MDFIFSISFMQGNITVQYYLGIAFMALLKERFIYQVEQ